jgi:NAD(P)-dependent dehydrogenase (short-subunit alcohol dehydrogenase family)
MSADPDFSGKVAVVTGAASGMGRATAEAFARAGARVVLADVSAAAGEEAARRIRATGGDAVYQPCDVRQEANVQALVARAASSTRSPPCARSAAA